MKFMGQRQQDISQFHHTACVVRLSALGDVVLISGILAHWHVCMGLRFHVLTKAPLAPLFDHHPAVIEAIPAETAHLRSWLKQGFSLRRHLGNIPLIDLHGNTRTRLLSAIWTGPTSTYPKMSLLRRLYRLFPLSNLKNRLENWNVPQRYAAALEIPPPPPNALRPRIYLTEAELELADQTISKLNLNRPFVVLHPLATHPAKAWPMAHWLKLTTLLNNQGIGWVVIGQSNRTDQPWPAAHDLTNQTHLRQTCALIARADAMISNDSGPMHLGTAVGTPVLGLFGPTAKAWGFIPSGEKDQALSLNLACAPCSLHGQGRCKENYRCLTDLKPELVIERLLPILSF